MAAYPFGEFTLRALTDLMMFSCVVAVYWSWSCRRWALYD